MELDAETKNLIVSAKLGDEKVLNLLFARYQQRILRIVRLRLNQNLRYKLKLQSMDIVQEVFMYALQHLKEFEPKSQGHFLNWMSKKVEHYICDRLDYVSRIKRDAPCGEVSVEQRVLGNDSSQGLEMQIKADETTPSQFAVKKDREEIVDSILEQLEPEERELIINRNLEEMTFAEIGESKNENADAVRKRYNRAFKKLIDLAEEKLKPIIAEESFKQYKDGF
ncbi:MAG: sigma-70 family RNA polymerase sigma factor [Candidatus Omnitrophota bacterium]